MATENKFFEGFLYVKGTDVDSVKTLDNALGYEDTLNSNPNTPYTYRDILNRFYEPVEFEYRSATQVLVNNVFNPAKEAVLHYIVEEVTGADVYKRTTANINGLGYGDNSDNLNLNWSDVFNIMNYIYGCVINAGRNVSNDASKSNSLSKINSILSINANSNFTGYIPGSLVLEDIPDAPLESGNKRLRYFAFQYNPESNATLTNENNRVFRCWIDPVSFIDTYEPADVNVGRDIKIYYKPLDLSNYTEGDISDISDVLNTITDQDYLIHKDSYKYYASFDTAKVLSDTVVTTQTFHIFSKRIPLTNIYSNETIISIIKDLVVDTEYIQNRPNRPDAIEEAKYHYQELFGMEERLIIPLYPHDDNDNFNTIKNPLTVDFGSTVESDQQLSIPWAEALASAKNHFANATNLVAEVIYLAYKDWWFPILVVGKNGAVSDYYPRFRPVKDDITTTSNEDNAGNISTDTLGQIERSRIFHSLLTRTICWWLYSDVSDAALSPIIEDIDNYHISDSVENEYSFMLNKIKWRCIKGD